MLVHGQRMFHLKMEAHCFSTDDQTHVQILLCTRQSHPSADVVSGVNTLSPVMCTSTRDVIRRELECQGALLAVPLKKEMCLTHLVETARLLHDMESKIKH